MQRENLLGVVLCGGRSSRMGRDKGLLLKDHKYWSEKVRDLFRDLEIPSVISINEAQSTPYGELYSSKDLVIDKDFALGPLNGILSCHHAFPARDLFIIATDMPDLIIAHLQPLIHNYINSGKLTAWKYQDEVQPLCSIYPSKVLQSVMTSEAALGVKIEYGPRKLFQKYDSDILPIPNQLISGFSNYNY